MKVKKENSQLEVMIWLQFVGFACNPVEGTNSFWYPLVLATLKTFPHIRGRMKRTSFLEVTHLLIGSATESCVFLINWLLEWNFKSIDKDLVRQTTIEIQLNRDASKGNDTLFNPISINHNEWPNELLMAAKKIRVQKYKGRLGSLT